MAAAHSSCDSVDLQIVVPVFNERAAIGPLVDRLQAALAPASLSWSVIFVDDGSTDGSWAELKLLSAQDRRVRAVSLSRNYGHQIALSAGISVADAALVVTMDGDLQHPPEVIPKMLVEAYAGFDVVYAVRADEDAEGWFKRGSATLFYRLLNRLTDLDLPRGAADFRLMDRAVVDALRSMPERNRFLRGMTRWVGFRQTHVTYSREARHEGESRYTLRRMIRFALDAIVSFSAIPLKAVSLAGFVVSVFGFAYLLYVLAARIFTNTTVPGWTSVTIAVLMLGGIQLICIGIIGEYLARMYDEVKGRPLYLVQGDTRWSADAADAADAVRGRHR